MGNMCKGPIGLTAHVFETCTGPWCCTDQRRKTCAGTATAPPYRSCLKSADAWDSTGRPYNRCVEMITLLYRSYRV